jgi:hypothetical protein
VIRLDHRCLHSKLILSRIDPADPATSVLIRVRLKWEDLLTNLNGRQDLPLKMNKRCAGVDTRLANGACMSFLGAYMSRRPVTYLRKVYK